MLWAAAYLRGDCGPDDAAEHSYGAGRSGPAEHGEALFDWLTGLRRLPLAHLRLVLPVPGRIAGLVGPPPAVMAAIDAGQALVVTAAGIPDHTLVPDTEAHATLDGPRTSVAWRRFAAPLGAHLPPDGGSGVAREELLGALRRAAGSSVDLDLVPDEPIAPGQIPADWSATTLPAHVEVPEAHLLTLAARILLLTRAELESHSPHARHLAEQNARRDLLNELNDAARGAVVEAVGRAAQVTA